MTDLLVNVIGGIVDLFLGFLPDSPFVAVSWTHDWSTALGYLNWFIDFGRCALLFAAWLALVALVTIVRTIINEFRSTEKIASI